MTATLSSPSVDEIIAKLGAQSTCDAGLTQDPWHFDTTKPSYGPGASMFDPLPSNAPRQQVLPEEYRNASDEELQETHPRSQIPPWQETADPRPLLPAR